jgi:ATP-dependent DNA helicase DinG
VDKAEEHLRKALTEANLDVKLLVQRRGDVVADLVRNFATDITSILLGTVSLWQGVDVPGEACSLVVIDRVPFPRPDDPLFAARQARVDRAGGSGFRSIAVPRAALLLAQGAGRLLFTIGSRNGCDFGFAIGFCKLCKFLVAVTSRFLANHRSRSRNSSY